MLCKCYKVFGCSNVTCVLLFTYTYVLRCNSIYHFIILLRLLPKRQLCMFCCDLCLVHSRTAVHYKQILIYILHTNIMNCQITFYFLDWILWIILLCDLLVIIIENQLNLQTLSLPFSIYLSRNDLTLSRSSFDVLLSGFLSDFLWICHCINYRHNNVQKKRARERETSNSMSKVAMLCESRDRELQIFVCSTQFPLYATQCVRTRVFVNVSL